MEVVNVTVVDTPEVVAVNVAVGFGTVVNSDATYSATVNSGDTLVVPDTTWTDSDGTPMTTPATLPIVCTPPVTLGVDIVNSDLTLNDHANDGDTYVVADTIVTNSDDSITLNVPATQPAEFPDTKITNSTGSFDVDIPSGAPYELADVPNVDSDGSTVMTPAMVPFVATPCPPVVIGEQFYILFPAYYKSYIDITIDASSEGTYVDELLTNAATAIYTVNTVPVTIPFSVVNGDTLGITITRTDYSCLAVVELTNQSISPYTYSSNGYTSVYPPAHNDTYVKATSCIDLANYAPYFATDPSKLLTGTWVGRSFISGSGQFTNQRFHIDLGSAHSLGRIYYENSHYNGYQYTEQGFKDFTLWGSNSASDFADLTYANDGTWTQITGLSTTRFLPHQPIDASDPHYVVFPKTTAYRYWALKIANNYNLHNYMVIRRIELQE